MLIIRICIAACCFGEIKDAYIVGRRAWSWPGISRHCQVRHSPNCRYI